MNKKQLQDLGSKIGAGIVICFLISLFLWLMLTIISNLLPKSLTNDQIINETKKCESSGMQSYTVLSVIDGSTTKIICKSKVTE